MAFKMKKRGKTVTIPCGSCKKEITRLVSHIKNKKNIFCNRGCFSEWQKIKQRGVNNSFYGKKHSQATMHKFKERYTLELRKKYSLRQTGKGNSFYGKKHKPELIEKFKQERKGRVFSMERNKKLSLLLKGRKLPPEQIEKLKIARKGLLSMEKHPNWCGGKSFETYGFNFNKKFKKEIYARDNHTCQICHLFKEDILSLKMVLCVHHIDYDKKNNLPQNCVSLCSRCHSMTNWNREGWPTFFRNMLFLNYNYQYTEDGKIIICLGDNSGV